MAKKIAFVVCGISWGIFGISFLFTGDVGGQSPTGVALCVVGAVIGIISLIALAAMALIDYARRPR